MVEYLLEKNLLEMGITMRGRLGNTAIKITKREISKG